MGEGSLDTPWRRALPDTIETAAAGLAERLRERLGERPRERLREPGERQGGEPVERQGGEPGGRILLGLCGPPGAGKSTLAAELARILGPDTAIVAPMDGFHLATDLIRGTPLAERRGAIDTFDPGSYLSLLRRLRARDEDVVYAPSFRRGLEEPIAASIAIPRSIPVVITEGNYLLADAPAWRAIRGELDSVWYLEVSAAVRLPRLIGRHVEFGRGEADAAAFARGSDQSNADLIESTRQGADLIVVLRG